MLQKLAQVRHMFQWSPDAKKADDYERKILNGIMGVQKPESMGEMLYMTPLGHGEMVLAKAIVFSSSSFQK